MPEYCTKLQCAVGHLSITMTEYKGHLKVPNDFLFEGNAYCLSIMAAPLLHVTVG